MEDDRKIPAFPVQEEADDYQLNIEDGLFSDEGDDGLGAGFYRADDAPFRQDDPDDIWADMEEDDADEYEEAESEETPDRYEEAESEEDADRSKEDRLKEEESGDSDVNAATVNGGDSGEGLADLEQGGSDYSGPEASAAPAGNIPAAKTKKGTAGGKTASVTPPGEVISGKELENTLARVQSEQPKKKGKKGTGTYREKILRHKRRRYRRTVFLVILVMLALVAGVILWMFRGYRSAELRRVATLSAEDGAAYANLNGNVVQYGGNGATCIGPRGDTLWTVSYEMQQPVVSVSGNVIAIGNRNGYYVYIMDTDGLMGTIHTMLPIQNIAAAENGEVAVIMSDSRATWVRLYTAKGKEIAYLVRTMKETGYPIAAAVSPDGETLCLSSLQMSSSTVKTSISFYNFGKRGREVNDHLIDNTDYIDETVPYLHYLDESTCVGVSDKRLIIFRDGLFRSQGSLNILFSENLQGVFSSANFTGLLFTNTGGDSQYRLDIYNRRGKKNGSIDFSMQFTNISIAGDKVYINNEHHVQIYSLGGRCIFDGEVNGAIRALVPGATLNDLLVVTGSEVDSVRLH